ncbi:uncharacterized protein LOC116108186 [Pistacia vera]|uniref:uncharacterized protein LOC116108186 n=1 Tax=Pistacia vera TaxID=55513 RepID=UPI001262C29F|nr:uncharacterized protein LOC116108186 [Pistacia vera]
MDGSVPVQGTAPRAWFEKLRGVLLKKDFQNSPQTAACSFIHSQSPVQKCYWQSAIFDNDMTRFGIVVNRLSQFLQSPSMSHWVACKRVLRYIKGTLDVGLQFQLSQNPVLEGFADADVANDLNDRKSTSGFCIYLFGNLDLGILQTKGGGFEFYRS